MGKKATRRGVWLLFFGYRSRKRIDVLQRAWPTSRDELESDMSQWFLVDAPAGIAWNTPEGHEIWS
ncbi:DUF596 domain-containing protein [Stenotrophomonas humi]|uniref:DUF596 domain-containing protein n=1 Tax=Stenotrophomonas humi TaxID=405444 RepID=UPI0009FB47EC